MNLRDNKIQENLLGRQFKAFQNLVPFVYNVWNQFKHKNLKRDPLEKQNQKFGNSRFCLIGSVHER